MPTTNINIRVDKELKENCEELFESLGLNMSTAIHVFLRQSLRCGGLPFEVKLDAPERFRTSPSGKEVRRRISKTDTVAETEQLQIYDVSLAGISYRLAFTRRAANKRTRIHCDSETVLFEERIPIGTHVASENTMICKTAELLAKERRCILVISGTPDMICGLDEGIIASANRYAEDPAPGLLYVMSERAFEKLEL